jgi:hypothetical protein
MALVQSTLSRDRVFWQFVSLLSQPAAVTLGGANAVLAYMAQEELKAHWRRFYAALQTASGTIVFTSEV